MKATKYEIAVRTEALDKGVAINLIRRALDELEKDVEVGTSFFDDGDVLEFAVLKTEVTF